MSEFGAYIKKVRESKNLTLNQVALYSEISAAQLSRIETGKRGVPKPATIKKLAEALKLDYEDLMVKAGHISSSAEGKENMPSFSQKEEKDIAKKLESILNDLDSDSGLAFDGEPLDETTRELVKAQIESNLRLAKQLAKKKFTPKKYRDDSE